MEETTHPSQEATSYSEKENTCSTEPISSILKTPNVNHTPDLTPTKSENVLNEDNQDENTIQSCSPNLCDQSNSQCEYPSLLMCKFDNLRRMVTPLKKEQLIDLIAHAAEEHEDVKVLCVNAVSDSLSSRRLMIRNIAFDATDSQFSDLFRQFGEIEDSHIVRDKDKKSKGYGFVTYKYLQSAQRCMQNPLYLENKVLFVKLAAAPVIYDEQRKLFIRNLSLSTNELTLHNLFSKFGEIEECTIVRNKAGMSKCYGFIKYKSAAHARKALEQRDVMVDGKTIFVYLSVSPGVMKKKNAILKKFSHKAFYPFSINNSNAFHNVHYRKGYAPPDYGYDSMMVPRLHDPTTTFPYHSMPAYRPEFYDDTEERMQRYDVSYPYAIATDHNMRFTYSGTHTLFNHGAMYALP